MQLKVRDNDKIEVKRVDEMNKSFILYLFNPWLILIKIYKFIIKY